MSSGAETVNYDSDPVLQVELDGVDYRLDSGKQGTARCISQREPGTRDWEFVGEAKWELMLLKCKALSRNTNEKLGRALKAHLRDQ